MRGSVAGKPYVIIIELVLAVLALVIVWYVFAKFFGFGAGVLSGFIESVLGQAGKAAVKGILGIGTGNPTLGGALGGCAAGAGIGAFGGPIGAGIGCAIGAVIGGLLGWWSTT